MGCRLRLSVSNPIPTGCHSIDSLLGGGFHRETVSQIYGPPAAGKTNVALSTAITLAQTGGKTLYIDTEGVSIDRFEQLVQGIADQEHTDSVTDQIILQDAYTFEEQESAVRDAADIAPELELIVVDSATGFYRLERTAEDEGETLRRVGRQITHLLSLARKFELAILITNQVFADPESEDSRPRPLGGHTLNHWSGIVLRLDRFRGGQRRVTLEKHQSEPAGNSARFRITATGIEGIEDEF